MGSGPIYHHAASSPVDDLEGRRLILSVDDDLALLYSRFQVLTAAGYAVLSASDAAQALDLFGNWRPDLVLLDYGLPTANGAVVAEAIKAHSPYVPIVMVAGNDNLPGKCFRLANLFLSDTHDPGQLLESIRKLLPVAEADDVTRETTSQ